MHGFASLPVLELYGSQAVSQPFVEGSQHLRRLRKTKVSLPTQQVWPELLDFFSHTAPARTTSQFPDPLFERRHGFIRHPTFDLASFGYPQTVAKELTTKHTCYCTLGLIDRQAQSGIQPSQ